jgi:hypothetical protein
MRRFWILVPAALAIAVLALGCGSGEKADTAQNEPAATEETHAQAGGEANADHTGGKLKVPADAEMASVTLEGNIGCGHCNFHVKEECSLAFKDTDGEIYIIDAGDQQEELMDKRMSEPSALIAGRVGEVDGQKVIYTDSVELR